MTLTCGCDVITTDPARIILACEQHRRISLRDHFAGQAIGDTQNYQTIVNMILNGFPTSAHEQAEAQAKAAYLMADAMLAQREKGGA